MTIYPQQSVLGKCKGGFGRAKNCILSWDAIILNVTGLQCLEARASQPAVHALQYAEHKSVCTSAYFRAE